jgi:hypothetical protein
MICSHGGNWFTGVPHYVTDRSKNWLIRNDEPVGGLARNVLSGDDGFDTIDFPRFGDINGDDFGEGMRASQSGTEQHILGPHVIREGEPSLNFGHTIWTGSVRS